MLCPDTRNPPSIASCFVTTEPPLLAAASFSVAGGSDSLATEIVSAPCGRASHATSVSLLSASFFGSPSGKLIENAFSHNAITVDAWWAIVPPGVAVALVILGCTMIGQAIEDTLNPRLRVGHLSVRRFRLRPLTGKEQV